MLNYSEIEKLKEEKFYKYTMGIRYNIGLYFQIKTNSLSVDTTSPLKIITTLVKFSCAVICIIIDIFKIKAFKEFRNDNILIFLRNDLADFSKDVLSKLETPPCKWLDVKDKDFDVKIKLLTKDTRKIYENPKFIDCIKNVSEREVDTIKLGKKIEELIKQYQQIVDAWSCCPRGGCISFDDVKKQYNGHQKIIENMQQGQITSKSLVKPMRRK